LKNPKTIIDALYFWLNFEQSCLRQSLFNEKHLSYPIGQFLSSRYTTKVRSEYNHPILCENRIKRGKKPKIDFVVCGSLNNIELAIETKWASKSTSLRSDIIKDLLRLSLLTQKYNCSSYFIFAGKKKFTKSKIESLNTLKVNNKSQIFPLLHNEKIGVLAVNKIYESNSKFSKNIFKNFEGISFQNKLKITKLTGFKQDVRDSQYVVFGWRIQKTYLKNFTVSIP
jgi:hypothetical protein